MSHRQHLCPNHPDGKQWVDGAVSSCEHDHGGDKPRTMRRAFVDRKAHRQADKAQGSIGTARDGYISGADYGR